MVHQSQAATTVQLFAGQIFDHSLVSVAAARKVEAGEGGGAGFEDAGVLETATGCEVGGLDVTHCRWWAKRAPERFCESRMRASEDALL